MNLGLNIAHSGVNHVNEEDLNFPKPQLRRDPSILGPKSPQLDHYLSKETLLGASENRVIKIKHIFQPNESNESQPNVGIFGCRFAWPPCAAACNTS